MSQSPIKQAKRIIVLVVGITVLVLGGAMLVLPGPGILVVSGGLAILGTEFVWARRLLKKVREETTAFGDKIWNRDSGE